MEILSKHTGSHKKFTLFQNFCRKMKDFFNQCFNANYQIWTKKHSQTISCSYKIVFLLEYLISETIYTLKKWHFTFSINIGSPLFDFFVFFMSDYFVKLVCKIFWEAYHKYLYFKLLLGPFWTFQSVRGCGVAGTERVPPSRLVFIGIINFLIWFRQIYLSIFLIKSNLINEKHSNRKVEHD